MRRSHLASVVSLLWACSSTPAEPPEASVAAVAPNPDVSVEAFSARCLETCARDRQMQAMAPEAIRAGCQNDCAKVAAAPVLADLESLRAHVGREVLVKGRLRRSDGGFEIELADGIAPIDPATGADEPESYLDRAVLLSASLEEREGAITLTRIGTIMRTGVDSTAPGSRP